MALAIILSHQSPCIERKQDDSFNNLGYQSNEDHEKTLARYDLLLETLPKGKGWMSEHLVKYKNFWLTPSHALKGTLLAQEHFNPNPNTLFLASSPKSGTTWLRSLVFSIINRDRFDIENHPLLTTNPHDCFPFLEAHVCEKLHFIGKSSSSSITSSSDNLYATHIPYSLLPTSIKGCKIVYVSRDPKDVFFSKWHFMSKLRSKQLPTLSLEEAFELFCNGVSHYGPYWNHALEYWKASLDHPHNILFIKYEDLTRDPSINVKKLARFIGKPFAIDEERNGMVEEIVRLCSFEHLSKLKINTKLNPRRANFDVKNKDFFRKGVVGDGKKKLSEEMINRIDRITEEMLLGTGLSFQ